MYFIGKKEKVTFEIDIYLALYIRKYSTSKFVYLFLVIFILHPWFLEFKNSS